MNDKTKASRLLFVYLALFQNEHVFFFLSCICVYYLCLWQIDEPHIFHKITLHTQKENSGWIKHNLF